MSPLLHAVGRADVRSSMLLILTVLLPALACTATTAPGQSTHKSTAATPPEPAEPKPAKPTEPTEPAEPIPGFVLYTREQSILVPFDGSAPTIAEGLWVQDDRHSPAPISHAMVMSRARAKSMALPACACLAYEGACEYGSLESRDFDPVSGAVTKAPKHSCTCLREPEPLGFPALEVDGEMFEPCAGDEDEGIASLVAGRLYYQGWDWNGACHGGLSIYDALAWSRPLITDPPTPSNAHMRSLGCNDQDFGLPEVSRPWPIDAAALTKDCGDGDTEAELFMLRRGELWEVGDNISGVGGWRSYAKRELRPDSCPSINDPCGDPKPFEERARLGRRRREFWIATGGAAALTAERDAYALWLAGSDAPAEFELPGIDASSDLIGVRVHADLVPLRALMKQHRALGVDRPARAPTTLPLEQCQALRPDACTAGVSAKTWGNECFSMIGIEQWSVAEVDCACGLAVASEPGTRGALLYNLGLIAEAQGAWEQAAVHYRESLRVRPGNTSVKRRLTRIEHTNLGL